MNSPQGAAAAAGAFGPGGASDVRPYGNGNVHETYLVRPAQGRPFILQRLNARVFPRPDLVMANVRTAVSHVGRRLASGGFGTRRFEIPEVLLAQDGSDRWVDPEGAWWRALSFIGGAHAREVVSSPGEAEELGWALGAFHALLDDLPAERLADTLEGFHVTPGYLDRFREVLGRARPPRSPEEEFGIRFVAARAGGVGVLEAARERGALRLRPIHGDPKAGNVLLDDETGRAVALVDLDTVKPGLLHYDLGDALRSACNPLGEETGRWQDVRFEPELCRALLRGYLDAAGRSLTPADREHVYDAARLLALELGLRFLTDHLEGDVYFRTRRPGHNLARALVQFRLTESIEAEERSIRAVVRELG